jgi:DNA-binding CsgD family transcriptional regulator
LLLQLIRAGWGTPNPKFRRVFATMFLPDGSAGLYAAFDELQRVSATPDVAYRLRGMFDSIDVTRLCGQVLAPTLVMHLRDDGVVPFEEGRLLAALIPGSRFVPLEGTGHILVPGTRGWTTFFHELGSFLEAVVATDSSRPLHAPLVASRSGGDPAVELLTRREREVMAAVADGQTNTEIAEVMGISPRTIERHLANVYSKLGLEGKAARAAASARVARSEVREERRG